MSVFRLEIDMAFKTEDDMVSFLNLLEKMNDKLADKKDGELPIHKKVRYHECKHDEGGACSGYVNVEIGPKTEYVPIEGDETGAEEAVLVETVHKKKNGNVIDDTVVIPADTQGKIKKPLEDELAAEKAKDKAVK